MKVKLFIKNFEPLIKIEIMHFICWLFGHNLTHIDGFKGGYDKCMRCGYEE